MVSNNSIWPEPDPAPDKIAITTMSSENPMPSDAGDKICDPKGIIADKKVWATFSLTALQMRMASISA